MVEPRLRTRPFSCRGWMRRGKKRISIGENANIEVHYMVD